MASGFIAPMIVALVAALVAVVTAIVSAVYAFKSYNSMQALVTISANAAAAATTAAAPTSTTVIPPSNPTFTYSSETGTWSGTFMYMTNLPNGGTVLDQNGNTLIGDFDVAKSWLQMNGWDSVDPVPQATQLYISDPLDTLSATQTAPTLPNGFSFLALTKNGVLLF